MAGLLIHQLVVCADAQRVLIVAPGSRIEQWQDEMVEKFGLSFSLLSRELIERLRLASAKVVSFLVIVCGMDKSMLKPPLE